MACGVRLGRAPGCIASPGYFPHEATSTRSGTGPAAVAGSVRGAPAAGVRGRACPRAVAGAAAARRPGGGPGPLMAAMERSAAGRTDHGFAGGQPNAGQRAVPCGASPGRTRRSRLGVDAAGGRCAVRVTRQHRGSRDGRGHRPGRAAGRLGAGYLRRPGRWGTGHAGPAGGCRGRLARGTRERGRRDRHGLCGSARMRAAAGGRHERCRLPRRDGEHRKGARRAPALEAGVLTPRARRAAAPSSAPIPTPDTRPKARQTAPQAAAATVGAPCPIAAAISLR